jgi:MtN3 and saliva related transmembrane protein
LIRVRFFTAPLRGVASNGFIDGHRYLPMIHLAAVLTSLSYIPQVQKAWPHGATKDLSLKMLAVLSAGLILWICYGILNEDCIIVLANSMGGSLGSGPVLQATPGRNRQVQARCDYYRPEMTEHLLGRRPSGIFGRPAAPAVAITRKTSSPRVFRSKTSLLVRNPCVSVGLDCDSNSRGPKKQGHGT